MIGPRVDMSWTKLKFFQKKLTERTTWVNGGIVTGPN